VKVVGPRQGFGPLTPANHLVEVPAQTLDGILKHQRIAPDAVAFVWSDTQGFERHTIVSGRSLWSAGVPLYVELWPDGLAVHGGVAPFVQAARENFAAMIPRDYLVRSGASGKPQPISELAAMLQSLGSHTTDALFIP
jgi:hypothetical protein